MIAFSSSVHPSCVFQITIIDVIDEIRKFRVYRSLWPVDYDLRFAHQFIQCFPKFVIVTAHVFISINSNLWLSVWVSTRIFMTGFRPALSLRGAKRRGNPYPKRFKYLSVSENRSVQRGSGLPRRPVASSQWQGRKNTCRNLEAAYLCR